MVLFVSAEDHNLHLLLHLFLQMRIGLAHILQLMNEAGSGEVGLDWLAVFVDDVILIRPCSILKNSKRIAHHDRVLEEFWAKIGECNFRLALENELEIVISVELVNYFLASIVRCVVEHASVKSLVVQPHYDFLVKTKLNFSQIHIQDFLIIKDFFLTFANKKLTASLKS